MFPSACLIERTVEDVRVEVPVPWSGADAAAVVAGRSAPATMPTAKTPSTPSVIAA